MIKSESKKFNFEFTLRIIRSLIYFKVRKINLTFVKANRFLIEPNPGEKFSSQNKILTADHLKIINWLNQNDKLFNVSGFYQWKDRTGSNFARPISQTELEKLAVQRIKSIIWPLRVIKKLPFIKMIGVSGTIASGNPSRKSDIDLLIITQRERIWMTRLLVLFVIEFFGKRKKKGKKAGRICLNHFIAGDDRGDLKLKYQDLYSALETAFMIPVLNREHTLERFICDNQWVGNYLPNLNYGQDYGALKNYWQERTMGEPFQESKIHVILTNLLSKKSFNWLEKLFKIIQQRRIKRKRKKEKGGQVYFKDDALIFHPEPKSVYFSDLYREEMKNSREEIKELVRGLA